MNLVGFLSTGAQSCHQEATSRQTLSVDLLAEGISCKRPSIVRFRSHTASFDQIVGRYVLDEPEALVRAIYAARPVIARLAVDRSLAVSHLAERVGRSTDLVELALQPDPRTHQARWTERAPTRTLG